MRMRQLFNVLRSLLVTIPVVLLLSVTALAADIINVTVPTSFPVYLSEDQTVSVSKSAVICNNSDISVAIQKIEIKPDNGWKLASPEAANAADTVSNVLGWTMSIGNSGLLKTTGTTGSESKQMLLDGSSLVLAKGDNPVTYSAAISSLSEVPTTETAIANVTFTIRKHPKVYVMLYTDGTLRFDSEVRESNNGVGKVEWSDEFDETETYSNEKRPPWWDYRDKIKAVDAWTPIYPTSTAYWFSGCNNLKSVQLDSLDGHSVTNARNMFENCSSLTSVVPWSLHDDPSSNITDMGYMFYGCSALKELAGWYFKSSAVTDMSYMFYDCSSLTSLDVSGFNTGSVTTMEAMFSGCKALTSLNISGFDTGNVTTMKNMFRGCTSLATLKTKTDGGTTSLNFGKVTDMSYMFYSCSALTKLDLSDCSAPLATTMSHTFYECTSLEELNLTGFTTTDALTKMNNAFQKCSSLCALDLSGLVTKNVTSMEYLFDECWALATLDATHFETSRVTTMKGMFQNCKALESLDVSGWDTQNVTLMNLMFDGCITLRSLSGTASSSEHSTKFNTQNVTDMSYMFRNCKMLSQLNVSIFNTGNVTTMSHMFQGLESQSMLDLGRFDTRKVTNMSGMMQDCKNLTTLILAGDKFSVSRVTDSSSILSGCVSLQTIHVNNDDMKLWIEDRLPKNIQPKFHTYGITPLDDDTPATLSLEYDPETGTLTGFSVA